MIRNPDAAELGDDDDALGALAADSVGVVTGFAADSSCLQLHYANATGLAHIVKPYADQAALFSDVAAGAIDYAWVLVTETAPPPHGHRARRCARSLQG